MVLHDRSMQELELELLKFPNGKHDDMIDALASCLALVEARIAHTPVSKPKTFFNRMTGKIETIQ